MTTRLEGLRAEDLPEALRSLLAADATGGDGHNSRGGQGRDDRQSAPSRRRSDDLRRYDDNDDYHAGARFVGREGGGHRDHHRRSPSLPWRRGRSFSRERSPPPRRARSPSRYSQQQHWHDDQGRNEDYHRDFDDRYNNEDLVHNTLLSALLALAPLHHVMIVMTAA